MFYIRTDNEKIDLMGTSLGGLYLDSHYWKRAPRTPVRFQVTYNIKHQ